jgi:hypothetical protein
MAKRLCCPQRTRIQLGKMRTTGGMPVMPLDCGGADEGPPPAAAAGSVPARGLPPPIGRSAVGLPLRVGWLRRGLDHGMARPRLRRGYPQDAANYYRLLRVKLSGGAAGARDKIQTIERAITAFEDGKTIRAKTVAHHHGLRQRHRARSRTSQRLAGSWRTMQRQETSSSRVRGWNAPVISLSCPAPTANPWPRCQRVKPGRAPRFRQ